MLLSTKPKLWSLYSNYVLLFGVPTLACIFLTDMKRGNPHSRAMESGLKQIGNLLLSVVGVLKDNFKNHT